MLDVMDADTTAFSLAQIDSIVEGLNPTRRQEEQNIMSTVVPMALRRGDNARALAYAERMLRSARDTGHRTCELEAHAWVATALCESGHARAGLASLTAARDVVRGVEASKIEFHHLLIEANAYLQLEDLASAHDALRQALALARAHGYTNGFQLTPHILARLCAQALQYDIEPQYAQRIIQIRGLAPPSGNTCEAWPWHVRIRVLGQVAIEVEGSQLAFNSKAQKKPLELLKALVAKGRHGASQTILAQELWPDSEGDVGESALRMALHRLRKLLRSDESALVREGKLWLNEKLCWVDAWALESFCSAIEAMSETERATQGDRLRALYAGAAFEGEAPQSWMLPARERWRGKLLRSVNLIGAAEEKRNAWARAVEVYRRGLEADPLSEDLYYQLMSCYLKQGKTAEAYATYRRCRDTLSVTLGVRPSPRTEALRQRVADLGASQ